VQRVYAVHKLIVAVDRVNKATSAKDIEQAQILIDALAVRRPAELADSWRATWNAGPKWRKELESGRARLSADAQAKHELPSTSGLG
jgi:hypothetical protein